MDTFESRSRSQCIERGLRRWLASFCPRQCTALCALLATTVFCLLPSCSFGQDRSADESSLRGNRAEVAITIKDNSGAVITTPATVRIYHSGMMSGQAIASKGRAFFILNSLGEFTITVEASGYKAAQKEISLPVAITDDEEILVTRDSTSTDPGANPGRPILAPKAKEAFDKGLQALGDNKLDEAEKHLAEAVKLAPNHPDVLYLQGVILLRRGQAEQAQAVLEKTTQIDPKNARAFTALGMAFLGENKYDLAVPPLQQSIQLDPSNWEGHWTLARTFYRQEHYDTALLEAQQAFGQSHGSEPAIELLIAQSQTAVGKFEDSADTLRTFLRTHPNDKGAANARRWLDRLIADGKIRKQ
jgi:tetratricopeptide (TPR) repeat protein